MEAPETVQPNAGARARAGPSTAVHDNATAGSSPRQDAGKQTSGACMECRKVKMRCILDADQSVPCRRCKKTGRHCVVPVHKPTGRKKGTKASSAAKTTDSAAVERILRAIVEDHLSKRPRRDGNSSSSEDREDDEQHQQAFLKRQKRGLQQGSRDDPLAGSIADQLARASPPSGSTIAPRQLEQLLPIADATTSTGAISTVNEVAGQGNDDFHSFLSSLATCQPHSEPQQSARASQYSLDLQTGSGHAEDTYTVAHSQFLLPSSSVTASATATAPYLPATSGISWGTDAPLPSGSARPVRPSPVSPCSGSIASKGGGSISNPLGLLADASEDTRPKPLSPCPPGDTAAGVLGTPSVQANASTILQQTDSSLTPLSFTTALHRIQAGLESLLEPEDDYDCEPAIAYFDKQACTLKRDIGRDLDPIDLGLVTMAEAQILFPRFMEQINPIMGNLDPRLHTPDFCRHRSALLFTWVLALSAHTMAEHTVLARRLRLHGQHLARYALEHACRSVEIVQGYYLSLVLENPAKSMSEERTWLYTSHAMSLATDLGLNTKCSTSSHNASHGSKFPSPEATPEPELPAYSTARSKTPKIVKTPPPVWLQDDLRHTDPSDLMILERMARNRERTWLRLLLWDRAFAAVSGRTSPFPETDLTTSIDSWWIHPLALDCDRKTCAFINLRRLLAMLSVQINNDLFKSSSLGGATWVRTWIDSVLDPWRAVWLGAFPTGAVNSPEAVADLHMHYVYRHGRLWTMSFALHHGVLTEGNHHTDSIKQDCLKAAMECCEDAVGHFASSGTSIMHVVSYTMIAYTAIFLLKLSPFVCGPKNLGAQARILGLLALVSQGLIKSGSESHSIGRAGLHGRQLRSILKQRAKVLQSMIANSASNPNAQGQPLQIKGNDYAGFQVDPANGFDAMDHMQDPMTQYINLDYNLGDQSSFASILRSMQPAESEHIYRF